MLHFLCRCSRFFTLLPSSQFYWHIRWKSTAYFFDPPYIYTRDRQTHCYFTSASSAPVSQSALAIIVLHFSASSSLAMPIRTPQRHCSPWRPPRNSSLRSLLRVFGVYTGLHLLRGGSVAEWLACWTQALKGLGWNRSRDAVWSKLFTPIMPLFTKQRNW